MQLQPCQRRESAQVQIRGCGVESAVLTRGDHLWGGVQDELPATGCGQRMPSGDDSQTDVSPTWVLEIVALGYQDQQFDKWLVRGDPRVKCSRPTACYSTRLEVLV